MPAGPSRPAGLNLKWVRMITEAVLIETAVAISDTAFSSKAKWAGGRGAFILSYSQAPSNYRATFVVHPDILGSVRASCPDLPPVTLVNASGANPTQIVVPFDLPPCFLSVVVEELSGTDAAHPKVVVVPIGG